MRERGGGCRVWGLHALDESSDRPESARTRRNTRPARTKKTAEARAPLQGYLAHQNPPPPGDPTVGPCLGPYGGPRGGAVATLPLSISLPHSHTRAHTHTHTNTNTNTHTNTHSHTQASQKPSRAISRGHLDTAAARIVVTRVAHGKAVSTDRPASASA